MSAAPPTDVAPAAGWWSRWRRNWAALREATDAVGAEVERWPYDRLAQPAERQPALTREVDGTRARFQVDCIGVGADGELEVCVDATGGPPTLLGAKPSYHFFKRRDGTVHYGRRS